MSRPKAKRPSHTCPDIDSAISALVEASRDAIRAAKRTDDGDASFALSDAASTFDSMCDAFEDLRKANHALRDSAEEWEAYADELEAQIPAEEVA